MSIISDIVLCIFAVHICMTTVWERMRMFLRISTHFKPAIVVSIQLYQVSLSSQSIS
jgi:hypothetical protein